MGNVLTSVTMAEAAMLRSGVNQGTRASCGISNSSHDRVLGFGEVLVRAMFAVNVQSTSVAIVQGQHSLGSEGPQ